MPVSQCHLVDIPRYIDERGSLSFLECGAQIPFDIKRVYYMYDVVENAERGAHAHKALQQFILAPSGSFEIRLDDGKDTVSYILDKPYIGLYVCAGIWRDLVNFSDKSVCMVLASEPYDEADYIRSYDEFMDWTSTR